MAGQCRANPYSVYLHGRLGGGASSDTKAGQARICARDKTGNRKETTQNPVLPDVTEPLFIFQEERKKNNINNIRCSIEEEKGDKTRRSRHLMGNLGKKKHVSVCVGLLEIVINK